MGNFPLDFHVDVAVIEIPRSLNLRRADFPKRFKSFRDTIFLDKPAGAFRAEIDLAANDEGKNDGRSKHESPIEIVAYVQEGYAHYIAEHDAKGRPHLPHHYERTTDGSGCTFSGIDRDGGGFGADAETEGEAGDEEVHPGVCDGFPDGGDGGDGAGDEDCATPAYEAVEGGCEPAAEDCAGEIGSPDY